MKKLLLTLFILSTVFLSISKAQRFKQGVLVDSTIYKGDYYFDGNCSNQYEVNISLDSSLFKYVDGLKFMVIEDSINRGQDPKTHKGDTIILNATNPIFQISTNFGYRYLKYSIKLIGTPITANQSYACKIETQICTCICLDLGITKSTTDTTTCNVEFETKINEMVKLNPFTITQNQFTNKLTISNISQKTKIQVYDIMGRLAMETTLSQNTELDTSNLKDGIYSVLVSNETNGSVSKKIVIQKN